MKKLLGNFKGYYKEIILGPTFKLLEAILELFVPLVMAGIIDIGIAQRDKSYIISHGLLLFLLALLCVGAGMVCQYYSVVVSGQFGRRLREQTYRHVMKLSGHDTPSLQSADLITHLTNDINQIQTGVNMAIRLATRAPFLAIGSIVMAVMLNWRIGIIFLVSTPLIVLILYKIMKASLPSYVEIQQGQDKISRLSAENLAGVRVIRAFSRQYEAEREFTDAADNLTALTVRVGKISMALNPITSFVVHVAIIGIIWFGAKFAAAGQIVSGEIIALVSYMNQTLLALIVIANIIVLFTRAIASAKRVGALLDTEPSIVAPAETSEHHDVGSDAVIFDDVTFYYHKGAREAIDNMSFTIPYGQTVGIIGGTGSGKTTLVNLIMRYFDINSGSISVCGSDVREADPEKLRENIGLVPQKAVLFSGSVRHNLKMSAPDADDDQLWHALEVAQGAEFVRSMPNGLDSMIEEAGKNLSGGQRQRLTIARALVRKPKLLILDDSTSALDYATDAALRSALAAEKKLNDSMTVVIISQRTASIKNADSILVLDDGHLVGQGTHDKLAITNEVYQEICRSQGIINGGIL